MEPVVIECEGLQQLLDVLCGNGYEVIGPTVRDSAIVCDRISKIDQLPIGWGDEQISGRYRLRKRNDRALFGYVVGPHSWKKFLHPPDLTLWKASRNGNGDFTFTEEEKAAPRLAFLGVRPCELQAISIQDKVFLNGAYTDPTYRAQREKLFIVAVNCSEPGGTCFCASMNTGPRASTGFDLALTELIEDSQHYFLVECGSECGQEILDQIPHRAADLRQINAAEARSVKAAANMGRRLRTDGLKELLYRNYDHRRWDEVARRCLTCGNCTMVCPTCFCTTVDDVTDLTGGTAERRRRWDSCFTMDFSYIHGGSVRRTAMSRYRQWMTHKLATWIDQFGTSGCVGCGRCITWCPVGIDITEEARVIRYSEETAQETSHGDS